MTNASSINEKVEETIIDNSIELIGESNNKIHEMKLVHEEIILVNKRFSRISCPECNLSLPKYKSYHKHLSMLHNMNVQEEKYTFETEVEFMRWKLKMESNTKSTYIIDSGIRIVKDKEKRYYICHRSYKRNSNPIVRKTKKNGSNKIGFACPSILHVEKTNNSLQVKFYPLHFGHECEIERQRLQKSVRSEIAGKLAIGVPIQRVLEDMRNVESNKFPRCQLIKAIDIRNVARDYKITTSPNIKYNRNVKGTTTTTPPPSKNTINKIRKRTNKTTKSKINIKRETPRKSLFTKENPSSQSNINSTNSTTPEQFIKIQPEELIDCQELCSIYEEDLAVKNAEEDCPTRSEEIESMLLEAIGRLRKLNLTRKDFDIIKQKTFHLLTAINSANKIANSNAEVISNGNYGNRDEANMIGIHRNTDLIAIHSANKTTHSNAEANMIGIHGNADLIAIHSASKTANSNAEANMIGIHGNADLIAIHSASKTANSNAEAISNGNYGNRDEANMIGIHENADLIAIHSASKTASSNAEANRTGIHGNADLIAIHSTNNSNIKIITIHGNGDGDSNVNGNHDMNDVDVNNIKIETVVVGVDDMIKQQQASYNPIDEHSYYYTRYF